MSHYRYNATDTQRPGGMILKLKAKTITVHTERTFTIARSSSDAFECVILEIEAGSTFGRGEAAPTARYDQDAESVKAALEAVKIEDPWDIEGSLNANATLPPSALAALDAALHDLAAKRLGIPVYRLLGLARPAPTTAYTLGIADPRDYPEERPRALRDAGLQDEGRRHGGCRDSPGGLGGVGGGDLGGRQRGFHGG